MVDGQIGPTPRVMLNVDQENRTGHELVPTHPHQVAELTV